MNGSPAPDLHIDDPHSIDFMLGQSLTPLGAATIAAQSPASGSGNGGAVDFKLDHVVDFSGTVPVSPRLTDEPLMAVSREPLIAAPAVDPLSISLQDLEVSLTPREQASDSEEIEVNTKLDLARAYVEMGDDEMAQGLLEEVRDVGSEQQKQEATVLLQRLGKA
jgi:pilus assembly protein FimV